MERCVGIDIGYGFVKITDGQEGYVFPSVVGEGSPDGLPRMSLVPPRPDGGPADRGGWQGL